MCSRNYYAMLCPYGITTASRKDTLLRFETEEERDLWVCLDERKRDALTRDQAKHYYPSAFTTGALWVGSAKLGALLYNGEPTGGVYSECK